MDAIPVYRPEDGATVLRAGVGHRDDEQVPEYTREKGLCFSVLQRHYTLMKYTGEACIVYEVVQSYQSAKNPSGSKDTVILGKVSLIFTALSFWSVFKSTSVAVKSNIENPHLSHRSDRNIAKRKESSVRKFTSILK